VNFDVEDLEGFMELSIDLLEDHAWLRDAHLVAFAAHRFDQDREVQNPSTSDGERIGAFDRGEAKGDVSLEFFIEP
jgi:hypothetical protein